MINISKYLKNGDFLINNKSTWQRNLLQIIEKNSDLIRKYKYVETYNFNLREKAKMQTPVNHKDMERRNDYSDDFEYVKECIVLELKNFTVVAYHASRYTKEEMEQVKEAGLRTSSKENCYNRIDKLFYDGYVSIEECKFLKKHCILNDWREHDRLGQIWFDSGYCDISTNYYGLSPLYNNYGGETIRNGIYKTPLLEKLNKISFPCSVIARVELSSVSEWQLSTIAENILLKSNKKQINKLSCEFFSEKKCVPITDIIFVNEHTKLNFSI